MAYGAAGTVITGSPPACRAYHNTTQTANSGAQTTIVFNSERYDTDTMHDTSSNTSRLTFKTPGLYLVTFNGELTGRNDWNHVVIQIKLNGTTFIGPGQMSATADNTIALMLHASTVYKFALNDYVEAVIDQKNTAAAAATINSTGNYSPEFTATWLGLGT